MTTKNIFAFNFLLLIALYFLGGKLGLMFYPIAGHATLVWPPAGISLAFLILFGLRLWPAIAIGSFLVNFSPETPILTTIIISLGSSLGILLGSYLFKSVLDEKDRSLRSFKSISAFVFLSALPSAVISAIFGGIVLTLTKSADFWTTWQSWTVGDLLSHLVLVPLIIKGYLRIQEKNFTAVRGLELLALLSLVSVANLYIFWTPLESGKYGLTFLLFPFLIWAAVRFGLFGTSVVTLVSSGIAIAATAEGSGPFSVGAPFENLLFLQFFIGIFALIGCALATAISERAVVKETLRENYSFLTSITESISDAIYVKDRAGKYLFINPYGARAMGGKIDDIVGKTDADFFTLESSQKLMQNDQNIMSSMEPTMLEEVTNLDGQETVFLTKKVPYLNSKNEVVGVLGVSRDISDRKLIEKERRESEQRFRGLADQAPVLIWSAGADKLCDWFNKPWLDFTGRSMEQELGNGWAEGVHPDDFDRCITTYIDSFDSRRSFSMDYRLRRYDGEYRWVVDHGSPRYTVDGRFAGYIGTCMDIHERRELELSLKDALRTRDDFLSIASHELKTPLTSLSLQAQLLLRQISTPSLKEQLDTAFKQIDKLNTLIEDLLDVSRIRTGRLRFHLEDFEVGHAMQEVLDRFRHQMTIEGYKVDFEPPPPTLVHWDRQRFDQVLSNLITNAIKYGNKNPLVITAEATAKTIRITVTDKGIGIDEEDQLRIFERFERAVSSRHFGGLGMGLYIVKQIVLAHGGEVRVHSCPGQGSSFVVDLPINATVHEVS